MYAGSFCWGPYTLLPIRRFAALREFDWFCSLPYSNRAYVIYQHTTIVIVVVVAFTFAFFSPSPNPVVQGFSELEFGVLES